MLKYLDFNFNFIFDYITHFPKYCIYFNSFQKSGNILIYSYQTFTTFYQFICASVQIPNIKSISIYIIIGII